MTSRKLVIFVALLITLCTTVLSPSFALFDKTRFVTDMGVAFFCFHHFVYKPYKAGSFATGTPHRTKALVKGGVALLFALNRVKAANKIAHNSKDPWLQGLAGSLDKMSASFASVGDKLKGGKFNAADVDGLNGTVDKVGAGAAAGGAPIKDIEVPVPGG